MYKCDKCGKLSEPKERCNITPCEIRTKHYPNGTTGTEIVKERKLCIDCFKGVSHAYNSNKE